MLLLLHVCTNDSFRMTAVSPSQLHRLSMEIALIKFQSLQPFDRPLLRVCVRRSD